MNTARLSEILRDTTVQLRKGEVYEGSPHLVDQAKKGEDLKGGGVLVVYAMPHEGHAKEHLKKIDMVFITIGVDAEKAESVKEELRGILKTYPQPERLAGGPSYIEVGAEIGDQGAALQLFALGSVLGFWDVITPMTLGMEGEEAKQMAGSGFLMISGFKG